jgi:uracil-DNA glycosylase
MSIEKDSFPGIPAAPPDAPAPPGYPAAIPRSPDLHALHSVMLRCTRCSLSLHRTGVVPGAGDHRADIFFVGEAPGAAEDREGIPFVGASGRLLDRMLEGADIRRADVFIANLVRCRPLQNRNPRAGEIAACSGWLREQLRLVDPVMVVTLGSFALRYFMQGASITRLQGTVVEVEFAERPLRLFPLLHPAAILRNPRLRSGYQEQFRTLASLAPLADRSTP